MTQGTPGTLLAIGLRSIQNPSHASPKITAARTVELSAGIHGMKHPLFVRAPRGAAV